MSHLVGNPEDNAGHILKDCVNSCSKNVSSYMLLQLKGVLILILHLLMDFAVVQDFAILHYIEFSWLNCVTSHCC